ncbi:hypothetical protein GCM10023159_21970 [Brevibacterium yomogidense]
MELGSLGVGRILQCFCSVAGMTHRGLPGEASRLLSGPWGQSALVGALTLIPARTYPLWLRRTLIWGPPVVGAIGFGYVAANPESLPQVGEERKSVEGATEENTESDEVAEPDAQGPPKTGSGLSSLSPRARAIVFATGGAAVGTLSSGAMAVGFWVDEKAERGLRKLKVPLPRVMMGCVVGALTWWQVVSESARRLDVQK